MLSKLLHHEGGGDRESNIFLSQTPSQASALSSRRVRDLEGRVLSSQTFWSYFACGSESYCGEEKSFELRIRQGSWKSCCFISVIQLEISEK